LDKKKKKKKKKRASVCWISPPSLIHPGAVKDVFSQPLINFIMHLAHPPGEVLPRGRVGRVRHQMVSVWQKNKQTKEAAV